MPARLLQTNARISSPVGMPRAEHAPIPDAVVRFSRYKMHDIESLTLAHCSIFSGLSIESCREILQSAQYAKFRRGQVLHREGDLVDTVVVLTGGLVKVVQYSMNGLAAILHLFGTGDIVSHPTPYPNQRYSGTALAIQTTEALVWDNRTFVSLLERFPQLRLNSGRILARQIRDIEDRFREISSERVPGRLAKVLIRLMNKIGSRNQALREIHISCEEISQLIGCSLFTVSRLLSAWEKAGIIRTRREAIQISKLPALEEVSSKMSVLPLRFDRRNSD